MPSSQAGDDFDHYYPLSAIRYARDVLKSAAEGDELQPREAEKLEIVMDASEELADIIEERRESQ